MTGSVEEEEREWRAEGRTLARSERDELRREIEWEERQR